MEQPKMWSSLPLPFQGFALSGFGCSVMCLSLLWWPYMNSLTSGLKCLFGNPESPPESPITLLIDSAAPSIFQNKETRPFKAWCPWGHAPELSRGFCLIRMSVYLNPKNIPKLRGYDLWNHLLSILSKLFPFQSISECLSFIHRDKSSTVSSRITVFWLRIFWLYDGDTKYESSGNRLG